MSALEIAVWALRAACVMDVFAILMVVARTQRIHRAAQFKPRPSTAQGLTGRFAPPVSVIVPCRRSTRLGAWLSLIDYPPGALEIVVAAPPAANLGDLPDDALVVRSDGPSSAAVLEAAFRSASGDVICVLQPDHAVGPGFVQRLVASLLDPFVGAAVGRVVSGRPGPGLAARIDDLDRESWSHVQLGRHVLGAQVTCDREPFACRAQEAADVGGFAPGSLDPEADLVARLYTRGFAIAYVEEAVALVPPATWASTSARTLDRTSAWRTLYRQLRPLLRRSKVLEGPEKTDVRWIHRGADAPLWLVAGWILVGALRLADTSWVPELLGGVLLLVTFSTAGLVPFPIASAAALQRRRRGLLALQPWLPLFALGHLWTGAGTAIASPFRSRAAAPRPVRRPAKAPPKKKAREKRPARTEAPEKRPARKPAAGPADRKRTRPAPRRRPEPGRAADGGWETR